MKKEIAEMLVKLTWDEMNDFMSDVFESMGTCPDATTYREATLNMLSTARNVIRADLTDSH